MLLNQLLLGDSTISTLNNLIDNLYAFLQICSNTVVLQLQEHQLFPLNVASNELASKLDVIKGNLEKLKSNTVKTV
jgi:GH18 family chitinase